MKRLWVIMVATVLVLGCATPHDRAVRTANSVAAFADRAHDALADRYQAALDACLALETRQAAAACGAKAKRVHAPAWAGYRALRSAWLALAAAIEASEIEGGAKLNSVEVAQLLARLAVVLRDFKALAAEGHP